MLGLGIGLLKFVNGTIGYVKKLCRNFTTLNDGVNQHYTIPTVTLTGDFRIPFEFTITTRGSFRTIIGGGSTPNFFRLGNVVDGGFAMAVDGSFASFPNSIERFDDGKLHKGYWERIGNDFNIHIDGVLFDTVNNATLGAKTLTLSQIGAQNSVNFWDGVLANIVIYDNTVSTTTPIRDYRINEDFSTTSTIIDYGSDGSDGTAVSITASGNFCLEGADWVGEELVVNGDFATDSDWTKQNSWVIGDGVASYTPSDELYSYIQQVTGAVPGAVYISKYTAVNNSGSCQIYHGGGAAVTASSVSGTYTNIKARGSDANFFFFSLAGFDGTVDNISYKRILQTP